MSTIYVPIDGCGRFPTPEERNQRRKQRWKKAGKFTRFLLVLLWLDQLFLCGLLAFVCFASGSAILSPIPIFLGLKIFLAIPCGIDEA